MNKLYPVVVIELIETLEKAKAFVSDKVQLASFALECAASLPPPQAVRQYPVSSALINKVIQEIVDEAKVLGAREDPVSKAKTGQTTGRDPSSVLVGDGPTAHAEEGTRKQDKRKRGPKKGSPVRVQGKGTKAPQNDS